MYSEKKVTQVSKFLSMVLRHKPQTVGITLDEQGWTDVRTLIIRMNTKGISIDIALLRHIVATNNKKRFAFNEDNTKIRANQGHSIDVDLAYEEKEPPAILYHGTSEDAVAAILKSGLEKRSRHHVHLSADTTTAKTVGSRHGKPMVLTVAAQQMFADGYVFYQSENGVWLTDHVPPRYIKLHNELIR